MHDPKFENEVQQKMEELGFQPSEAVWENVEKEIRKDHQRRVPFFWLFMLSGILLSGGGYVFFAHSSSLFTSSPSISPGPSGALVPSSSSHASEPQSASMEKKVRPLVPGREAGGPVLSDPIASSVAEKIEPPATGKQVKFHLTTAKNRKGIQAVNRENFAGEGKSAGLSKAGYPGTDFDEVAFNANPGAKDSDSGKGAGLPTVPAKTNSPELKDSASGDSKKGATVKRVREIRRWKLGLTGGIGLSVLDKSLFKRSAVPEFSNYTYALAAFPPGWQIRPLVQQGVSFSAGIFTSRYLSRKISLSIGLSDHFYSTEVQTNSGSNIVPSSLTGSLNTYFLSVPSVNKSGQGLYREQYNLLELPVSVQWQLPPIRKSPVYWETGFSLGRLIGTNSLYFDGTSGAFYVESNKFFARTQVSLSTAFVFGIPVGGKLLQLGPQLQYGLTDLQKNNAGTAQHLFFTGIKFSYMLGK